MTVYSFGSLPKPAICELRLAGADGMLRGPFSAYTQTIVRPKFWMMSCTWQGLSGGDRADLIAFFLKLNGVEHRVSMPIFGHVQRGTLGSSTSPEQVLVAGGSQTGDTLNVDGGTLTTTGWAKAGDIIQIGTQRQLRMVVADADTDGSGAATLTIRPALRDSPADNTVIDVSGTAEGIWILNSDVPLVNSAMMRRGDSTIIQDSLTLDFIDDASYS